jgi:hypothetical protein
LGERGMRGKRSIQVMYYGKSINNWVENYCCISKYTHKVYSDVYINLCAMVTRVDFNKKWDETPKKTKRRLLKRFVRDFKRRRSNEPLQKN